MTSSIVDTQTSRTKEFQNACKDGILIRAKALFKANPDILNSISANNNGAFDLACSNGHLEVAEWLLEVKPDILNSNFI